MSRASLDKDPREVAAMFDGVARNYDLTNDVLSLGMDRWWRRATQRVVAARAGEVLLDLAAGTGTSSEHYADAGVRVVPCDFSTGMLSVGKARRPDLAFVAGDALALPFAEESFDAVTISFGLRNLSHTEAGLREMARVTKPGGRLVIAEFSTPSWTPWRRAYRLYCGRVLPMVARTVSSNSDAYTYLAESIEQWPDQRALAGVVQRAGWREVGYRNLSGGIVALHRATKPA